MEKNILIFLLLFCSGNIFSQQVEGTVLNAASGEPMANVAIKVMGANSGTVSAEDGNFSLVVSRLPVRLEFSALGFVNKELSVRNTEEELTVYLFPEAESLSEIVLRSTIIPNELRKTPAAVSILSEADFERFDETNIVQVINTAPGVYVHQGALNTNKLSIRGIGARSQYSTNRVKAYFEEIPISTAEGETTLDDIDQSMIERAEIIKGPNSSVYGAGLGGVINLYAADADEDGTQASTRHTFGSFGLMKNTIKAAHASGSTNLVAAYNHLESDGFRENGDYERDSFTVHGRVSGNETGTLSVLAQFTRLMAYIPSSLNRETLENDPSSAAYTWGAAQGYESYDKGLFGLSYRHNFSDNFYNTTSVFMNFRDAYEPRPFDILKEEQVATGARTKFNFGIDFSGIETEFSVGSEIYREWYDTATFENLYEDFPGQGSIAGNSLSNNDQDRSYYNFFAQWNFEFSEAFHLETGVNLNTTKYELTDLFNRDEVDQSGDYRFETILSPRLGAVFNVSENKSIYASVSHGFSTPTVAETLTPEGLINTDLEPETGINYELGFKGNWLNNQLYTEVALFSIQVENLLVAERVGQDQYIGRNAGKTDHNGIEFLLNYNFDLTRGVQARPYVNAAFNFFEFDKFTDDGTNYSGSKLPGVPERSITAGFDIITDPGFNFHAVFQHQGEMPLDDANSAFNDSYNLLNLKASYNLNLPGGFETQFFAGVNNIFDEAYAASIVPNSVGFGGNAPRYFYPGNPRNYFGGVQLKYLF